MSSENADDRDAAEGSRGERRQDDSPPRDWERERGRGDREDRDRERSRERDREREGSGSRGRRGDRPTQETSKEGTSLYVANLSFRCTTPDLSDVFSKYGKLQSVSVQRWPHGESRGFGFVNFEDPDAADTAMRELQDTMVSDRPITIQKSRRSKPHDKTPGTYLGPRSASSKYGSGKNDDRGRPRSRERDDRRRDSRDDYGRNDRYDDRGGRGYSRGYDDRGRSRDDRGYQDSRDRHDDRRGGGRSRERYEDRRGYGGASSRYDDAPRGYDDRGARGGYDRNDRNYGRGRDAYERPPPPDDRRRY